jgi:hypothetical protein
VDLEANSRIPLDVCLIGGWASLITLPAYQVHYCRPQCSHNQLNQTLKLIFIAHTRMADNYCLSGFRRAVARSPISTDFWKKLPILASTIPRCLMCLERAEARAC